MKKLFNVIVLCLAINFIAIAAGAGWLFKAGHLDREKFAEVKKILFPPTTEPVEVATTQPAAAPQPTVKLDELLAKASGRSAVEQVEFIQQTFDAQVAQLDRRARELADLQRQVDLAKQQMSRDRSKLEQDQKTLADQQQLQTRLASDKGFQDSLLLYGAMAPKKVKEIFVSLSDDVIQNYLQAMEPKAAGKIIKEFKSPEEVARIQKVMERIRQSAVQAPQASAK